MLTYGLFLANVAAMIGLLWLVIRTERRRRFGADAKRKPLGLKDRFPR
jgi:hypothetical protein